jgi:signal transduction histidine kinase/ActR/RegA family two-component response regulator
MTTATSSTVHPGVAARLRQISRACAVLVLLIGGVSLLGWILDNEMLKGAYAAGITIKTNTAIALLFLGFALLFQDFASNDSPRMRLARLCGAFAALIGFVTLAEHLTGFSLGIDELLFKEATGALATSSPNRMGIPAATTLPLLGCSILLLGWRTRRGIAPAQLLAMVALLVTLVPLLGYLNGLPSLYANGSVTGIALPTALAFLIAGVGVLCARAEIGVMRRVVADDGGGIVVRRMIPAVITLPILVGYLRQVGQDAGLYDADFGRVIGTLTFICAFSALTLWTGKVISLSARARARAEAAELEMKERLLKTLESERNARATAERTSRMKDDFLATLSHELRTPLQAIIGWTHVLHTPALAPEDLKRGVETIERNARLQTQLIEDLLDMSRIVSGKISLDIEDLDLASIVDAVLEAVRPAAQAKNLSIEARVEARPAPVRGESARLQQILWNLISNAIKFTPEGGNLVVELTRGEANYKLVVRDDGVGIRPEILADIFERFSQADSSTKRRFGGLGLGLSIARQLAELHGGTLEAESDGEGLGASFTLTLPVAAALDGVPHEGADVTDISEATIDLVGLKLLVVDDQSDARELIARILRDRHAEVWTAQDVTSALGLLARERFDVLVSDIGMPARDGYDLIRDVRAKGNPIPAIALTAFARAEEKRRAIEAGYHAHLAKPVNPVHLARAIARLRSASRVEAAREA